MVMHAVVPILSDLHILLVSLWCRPGYFPDSWFWIKLSVLSALDYALLRLSAIKVIFLELELDKGRWATRVPTPQGKWKMVKSNSRRGKFQIHREN